MPRLAHIRTLREARFMRALCNETLAGHTPDLAHFKRVVTLRAQQLRLCLQQLGFRGMCFEQICAAESAHYSILIDNSAGMASQSGTDSHQLCVLYAMPLVQSVGVTEQLVGSSRRKQSAPHLPSGCACDTPLQVHSLYTMLSAPGRRGGNGDRVASMVDIWLFHKFSKEWPGVDSAKASRSFIFKQ